MAIVADRDLELIAQIYRDVSNTVTHKAHGERCNCDERTGNALAAVVGLALGSSGQMSPQLIGEAIRRALLPASLGMFLKEYPEVDVKPLPPLAYIEGWYEGNKG
ncbi:MAG: hypothetical protein HYT49_00060 [Candidatus Wildermuthbacteria bacterium]|nr:hypothetical protein [Candidatus Wildermuthbacteria bacterium]